MPWGEKINSALVRAHALFADGSDSSLARRLAGAAFLIRVVSAALTFVSQILLARWMGGFEFGVYIYGWTWILLIGGMVDLGLGSAAQRFIPEYTERKSFALLRGFLSGSRWLALLFGTIAGAAGAIAVPATHAAHRPGDRRSSLHFLRRAAAVRRLGDAERHRALL